MSYHPIAYKMEAAVRELIDAATTSSVRGSEHLATIRDGRAVYVLCDSAEGVYPLPAVADVTVRVEVRTITSLYSSFTTAVKDHNTLCGVVFDTLMDDDLVTSLTTIGTLTLQGVKSQETQSQRMEGSVLITTMSRMIRAVPQ